MQFPFIIPHGFSIARRLLFLIIDFKLRVVDIFLFLLLLLLFIFLFFSFIIYVYNF